MASGETPAIRRIQTKSFVHALRAHPRGSEVLERAAADVSVDALGAGFDFGWVDLREHEALSSPALAQLGESGYVDLWVEIFTGSLRQKFLASFTQLMVSLMGDSILPLARRSPRVYEHLARGCGSMRWVDRAEGGQLLLEGFPAGYDLRAWSLSNLGSLRAGAVNAGREPDIVVLEGFDEDARTASFSVTDGIPD